MTLSNVDSTSEPGADMDKHSHDTHADSSVSWRLNELLKAGEKAKAFASAGWFQPGNSQSEEGFTPWAPEVLGVEAEDDPELALEEAVDESSEIEIAETANPELEASVDESPEPLPAIDPEELERARRDSFDQGYQKAMAEAEEKWRDARNDFIALTESLQSAQSETKDFYQPLKKLALHIAEQLVRGELTLSTAAIERLVDGAIRDIEQQGEGPIVVSLSAADHRQFTQHLSSDLEHISLRIDPALSRGSVKIMMDDSAVEDLIEIRLATMSDRLLDLPRSDSAGPSADIVESSAPAAKVDSADSDSQSYESFTNADAIIEGNAEELNPHETRNIDPQQAGSSSAPDVDPSAGDESKDA